MKTTFALLRELTGLTSDEAARFLNVRLDTVKSWNSGRNPAPEGVVAQFKDLWRKIYELADTTLDGIELMLESAETFPEAIEYGLPASDAEAQEVLGLPTVTVAERLAGIVVAEIDFRVELVRRGGTPATRAALDIRAKTRTREMSNHFQYYGPGITDVTKVEVSQPKDFDSLSPIQRGQLTKSCPSWALEMARRGEFCLRCNAFASELGLHNFIGSGH